MARQALDTTGNEALATTLGKINSMTVEMYAASSTTPDPSVTTLTASGQITGAANVLGATVTSTALLTGGSLKVDTGTKTATATAGAATLAKFSGVITSEALTTAAAAAYTLTITLTALSVAATDMAFASVANGTNTQGVPVVTRVTCGTNSLVVVVTNLHASEALNGTLKISYVVLKA